MKNNRIEQEATSPVMKRKSAEDFSKNQPRDTYYPTAPMRINESNIFNTNNADGSAKQNLNFLQSSYGNISALRYFSQGIQQRVTNQDNKLKKEAEGFAEQVDENPYIQRPNLSRTGISLQFFPAGGKTTAATAPPSEVTQSPATTAAAPPAATKTPTPGLIVADSATELLPGQMKRSEFLAQLRTSVTSTAEEALAGTIWSTLGCPWINHWFSYYGGRDSQSIERAIQLYAPGTSGITSAADYIPIICTRVRQAIATWSATGQVTGVPEGIATGIPQIAPAPTDKLSFKGQDGGAKSSLDPLAVQSKLDSGRPLEGGIRSQMESAFGQDFSGVRVHTDSGARNISQELNARAFTVGKDIAFSSEEYKPGTLIGDALIAHELAHVVQQGGSTEPSPLQKRESDSSAFEEEADMSAVGTVASIWSGIKTGTANISKNALPRLRSGLKLQRCEDKNKTAANEIVEANPNKVEGLAQLFESEEIQDDKTVSGRLKTILEVTEHSIITGLQTGGPFDKSDEGFKEQYKDPWESSRNQPGHFLTAVSFAYNPGVVNQTMFGKTLREWINAPASMSDKDVALRLMIGHEKAPDPKFFAAVGECVLEKAQDPYYPLYGDDPGMECIGEAPWRMLNGFKRQFNAATDEDVKKYKDMMAKVEKKDLGTSELDMIEEYVKSVDIKETDEGCSKQDMRLSSMGWIFGILIQKGQFKSRSEAAEWLRKYLSE